MDRTEFKTRIRDARVIAVLRTGDPYVLMNLVRAYVSGGIRAIELTTSIPDWETHLEKIVFEFGGQSVIGMGTVTKDEDAQKAIDIGAGFIVSPFIAPDVIEVAINNNVPVIPGALTPSEIAAAFGMGADLVKVFPVSSVGGPDYIRSLLAPMPGWDLVPTGGVTTGDALNYLRAGAIAVGIGSNLVRKHDLEKEDWPAVERFINETFWTWDRSLQKVRFRHNE